MILSNNWPVKVPKLCRKQHWIRHSSREHLERDSKLQHNWWQDWGGLWRGGRGYQRCRQIRKVCDISYFETINCLLHWSLNKCYVTFQLYLLHPLRGATRLRGGQRGPGAGDQDEGARHRGREEAGVQQESFLPLRRGVQRTGEKVMFQMMETIRPNHIWEEQINAKQIFPLLLYLCSYSPIYLLSC